ncbi:MAG TPA: hypothetical protein VMY18_13800 [Acidobacteriota bacterium]|nr:hypothetical protein [Acidobacteriota bacterium]
MSRKPTLHMDPCHALWAAVIQRAILDTKVATGIYRKEGSSGPTIEERRQALEFLFDLEHDQLNYICEMLGLRAATIREFARGELVTHPDTRALENKLTRVGYLGDRNDDDDAGRSERNWEEDSTVPAGDNGTRA